MQSLNHVRNNNNITMHNLYFVIVDNQSDSDAARNTASDALRDHNFLSSEGYFGNGKCDWFVIGGRWSGVLSDVSPTYYEKFKALPWVNQADLVAVDEIKKRADELQLLWESLGGSDDHPHGRSSYTEDGYQDDARPLTTELLARLKKEHPPGDFGEVEVFIPDDYEETTLGKLDEKYADGKHWIVAVDYHN